VAGTQLDPLHRRGGEAHQQRAEKKQRAHSSMMTAESDGPNRCLNV
jgi:hypothetical protein